MLQLNVPTQDLGIQGLIIVSPLDTGKVRGQVKAARTTFPQVRVVVL